MILSEHRQVTVQDQSQVGEARRACAEIVRDSSLGSETGDKAAIVVTELATNLVKHANGGHILFRAQDGLLEVCCMDSGPGMGVLARALTDGFSTAGTAGNGLGAIKRLTDGFQIYSHTSGTVVWTGTGNLKQNPFYAANVCHPKETLSGDSTWFHDGGTRLCCAVVDGLGHGPAASKASVQACSAFEARPDDDPPDQMRNSHQSLLNGRGAAGAFATADLKVGKLNYAGVGNICGALIQAGSKKGLVSHNGTLGVSLSRVGQFEYPWEEEALLVMHSDGIKDRWSLDDYPGLAICDTSLIALVLMRDFGRGSDDASVVVVRLPKPEVTQ